MKSLSPQLTNFSRHDVRPSAIRRNFPQTEYRYQATTEAPAAAPMAGHSTPEVRAAQIRSFRQLSREAIPTRSRWQVAPETAVFGLVVGLMAWPLVSLLIVLAQTARG